MHVLITRRPLAAHVVHLNLSSTCETGAGWTRRGVTKELPGYLTFASSHPLVLLQDSSGVHQNVVLLGLLVLPIR
jgi:hypothetical protein